MHTRAESNLVRAVRFLPMGPSAEAERRKPVLLNVRSPSRRIVLRCGESYGKSVMKSGSLTRTQRTEGKLEQLMLCVKPTAD